MIAALLVALIVIVFALLNTQNVELNFIFGKYSMPLVLVLVISLLAGALIAVLLSTVTIIGLKRQLKESEIKRERAEESAVKKYEQKLTATQAKYQRKLNGKTAATVRQKEDFHK
ncbi:hypothetical protein FD46_GL001861 [Liquorilactobacillus oeni DSM 19972]|uniref:Lipopolysaccharide assembly protein A domain-containing protein n=2 Tax=Liquorilactobacillus oeni TaxID=303241 RepID=A0A0R1MHC8_9LACO|nr:hypothetical protein FD46_GL001861 [Liquorilactobacillus oeni DSM 19972]